MPAAFSLMPLWDRAAEWRQRIQMIRQARGFLYLSTFYIEWDAYGRELLEGLIAASHRGVDVSLLVDGFGQRSRISFSGLQTNVAMPAERFQFKLPAGADLIEQ